jgi:hypothetical protein
MRGLEPDAGDCCWATLFSAPFTLDGRSLWGLGGSAPAFGCLSFCFSLCSTCSDLFCTLWSLSVVYAYAVRLYI